MWCGLRPTPMTGVHGRIWASKICQVTAHRCIDHSPHLTRAIMSILPLPSTSRSNLDSIFDAALKTHKKKTGKDITSHPLANELQSCDSPDAILAVLRRQIATPDQAQSGDETFAKFHSNCQHPLRPFQYAWRRRWSGD